MGNGAYLQLHVDAVENGAGESAEIPYAVAFPAGAAFAGAIPIAAGAWVRRHDELELCGEDCGSPGQ